MVAIGCVSVIGIWFPSARGDEPSLLGELVFPKSSDVPIFADDKLIATSADIDTSARVREVQDDRLRIWVDAKKVEGWIKRSDVCTEQEAID